MVCKEKRMTGSERELAEELDATRGDEGEWSEEAVKVEVKSPSTQVVSLRVPSEEFGQLMKAVDETGESLSKYIRGALDLRLHVGPNLAGLEITARDLAGRSRTLTSRWSENPNPTTLRWPDEPPVGVSF